ncbi:MAG TPA: peptide chain release factor 2 [Firmicutes bacterium]|nr:peptide chain release factor 2 [Bacillota bacterium]
MGDYLDIEGTKKQLAVLEEKMGAGDFWQNPDEAKKVTKEASFLKDRLTSWTEVKQQHDDLAVLFDLAVEENDENSLSEVATALADLRNTVARLELATLLNGEFDNANAIISIHPGAGGTESQDWAEMLLRMYTRWAEEHRYEVEMLDYQPGDEAGIKSVSFLVSGPYAYGYLKAEKGVHRLVRISPFDASGRRHTSFASIDCLPEIADDIEIEIDPADLKIDTYRSSGAGGQHVNKTESAIRILHIPTGIVVTCQSERSQHSNREAAMKILRAKLYEKQREEQRQKLEDLRGEQREIAWGSQIRSYVFCPYTMVKDHRTNAETGNVQAVMDGDLDMFIEAYLRWQASQ